VYGAYLIDCEAAKAAGNEWQTRIGKNCGTIRGDACTFDQFIRKTYSSAGSYYANSARKGPFVYDDPKYSNGLQDRETTVQMAQDIAALEFGGAQMDLNKMYAVDPGNVLLNSYITLMNKVASHVQSLHGPRRCIQRPTLSSAKCHVGYEPRALCRYPKAGCQEYATVRGQPGEQGHLGCYNELHRSEKHAAFRYYSRNNAIPGEDSMYLKRLCSGKITKGL
jgi:hypothetical protein